MSPIRQLPPELELADAIGHALVAGGFDLLVEVKSELNAGAQVLVAPRADPDGMRRVRIGALEVRVDLGRLAVAGVTYHHDRPVHDRRLD